MGRMYGKSARKLVGIAAFIFCIGSLAAQIKALHWLMEHVFAEDAIFATIIALVVVILYASLGGVSSVIKTDVLQFIIFFVIVPLVAYLMIDMSGGIYEIVKSLPPSKSSLVPEGGIWALISLAVFWALPDAYPTTVHRVLIGKDCTKNQVTVYSLAATYFFNLIFVACVAFIALAKFPNIDSKETIFRVISELPFAGAMFTLFVVSLIAMITSTADSDLNTSSIMLINDVVTKKITPKQEASAAKCLSVFSGVVATIVAFSFASVIDIVLFFAEYYMIIVLIPLFVGVFLKRTNKIAFWSSSVVGVGAFSILHLCTNLDHEAFLISFAASLVVYFFSSFYN